MTADDNYDDGAYLDNVFGFGNISVTDSIFGDSSGSNGNGFNGLEAYSFGNVTLTDVTADGNQYDGALLGDPINYIEVRGNITVTGGDFSNNDINAYCGCTDNPAGLEAYADGSISLSGVTADNNYYDGVYLDNTFGSDNISVDNTSGGEFNDNGISTDPLSSNLNGLEVYSNGNVTLTDVIADGNYYDGALLGDSFNYVEVGGNITVTGGDFSNNVGNGPSFNPAGLEAYADGSITLNGVTANGNDNSGAFLGNDFGSDPNNIISVMNSTFGDTTSSNGTYGLVADSNEDITLTNVTATNNGVDGADLVTLGNVVVDPSTFNGNYGGDGLKVLSSGNVTLTDITADDNAYDGAYLDNTFGSGNISVDNSSFNHNGLDGADLFSFGAMTLNNVTASNNIEDGLFVSDASESPLVISNKGLFTSGVSLTVTGGTFNDNADDGIFADINGDVTLTGITASGNTFDGIYLTQSVDPTDTITCSAATDNGAYGAETHLSSGTTLTLNSFTTNEPNSFNGGTLATNSVNCHPGHGKSGGGLPINLIPITGGLDCTDFSGNELVLPNQDHAILPCPNGQDGTITHKNSTELPGALDGKFTYVSAFNVQVNPSLIGTMTVSFKIPSSEEGSNFTILYWDGTKWVNLGGSANPPGFFSVDTNLTGDFVLVTQ